MPSPPTDVSPVPPFATVSVPDRSVITMLPGTTSTVAAESTAPVPPETETLLLAAVKFAPVTLDAGMVGISAAASERKVGAAAPPLLGPANTVFALWLSKDRASVPDVVIGLPDTSKMADGADNATLVTVPAPAATNVNRSDNGRVYVVSALRYCVVVVVRKAG